MSNSETRVANLRLARNSPETGMFAVLAAQAVRKTRREGSNDVLADAARLLADAMDAYFRRGRPEDDDIYSDLVALALDRIEWCPSALSFVQDAMEAEPCCGGFSVAAVPDSPADLETSDAESLTGESR